MKYVKRAEPTVEVFICSDQTKTDIIKGCYVAVLEYESHLPMFTDLFNEYLGKPCQRSIEKIMGLYFLLVLGIALFPRWEDWTSAYRGSFN